MPRRAPTTQLTLTRLRRAGWTADVCERWLPHTRRRKDLFGAFDVVAVRADKRGVLAIQTTSASNAASRLKKLRASPAVRVWLAAGNKAEVWSFKQPGGPRTAWVCVRREVRAEECAG